jgi:hypothetical protein
MKGRLANAIFDLVAVARCSGIVCSGSFASTVHSHLFLGFVHLELVVDR